MPLEDLKVVAVGIPDAYKLQKFSQLLVEQNLPVWSALFINPRMAEMKNKSPLSEHRQQMVEDRIILPEVYITTLAFRTMDSKAVMERLPQIVKSCHGEILSESIAQHEWKNGLR